MDKRKMEIHGIHERLRLSIIQRGIAREKHQARLGRPEGMSVRAAQRAAASAFLRAEEARSLVPPERTV